MASTGDRETREQGRAKWGNLWDQIKSEVIDMYVFYIGGYRALKVRA